MTSKDNDFTRNVLSIQTPISVTVARKSMPVSEILELVPGAILRFEKRCSDPLVLEADGKRIARAKAVTVGDRMGVRIADAE